MATARLDLDHLEILVPKKRWQLYFLLILQSQNESDVVLSVLPERCITVKPEANNVVAFKPEGKHTEGMKLLELPVVSGTSFKIRLYLYHSRNKLSNTVSILNEAVNTNAATISGNLKKISLNAIPWYSIGVGSVKVLDTILQSIPDRDMGVLILDESFGDEINGTREIKRSNTLSSGEVKVNWRWSIN